MRILKISERALKKAGTVIRGGGVVICPTDTVYGFLTDASNKKAVKKIYRIKKRPKSKPLSLFVKDFKMAESLVEIDKRQAKIFSKFWPGKYTFVLKIKPGIKLYGVNRKTVALRIPSHPFLQKLLKKVNRPLAQTSVNISRQKPLNNIEQIIATFEKRKLIGLIIDGGDIKNAKPSKIIDLTSKKLIKLR